MVLRWAAAAFVATEQRYRRILGYRQLWILKAHLDRPRQQQEVADERKVGWLVRPGYVTEFQLPLGHLPTHGSWLNIAEIELNVLSRQCFCQMIGQAATLREQVAAWETERNDRKATIDWRFTIPNARDKLKRLYPVHDDL